MTTPPPRPPAFRGQMKTLRRQTKSRRSFSLSSGDRGDPQPSVEPGAADSPPFDRRGLGGIFEANAAPDLADTAVLPVLRFHEPEGRVDGWEGRANVSEDPADGREDRDDADEDRADPLEGVAETQRGARASDAEIQGVSRRRSFASLALASGTGEDVAALMGGSGKRRWRLNRDNARAVLIAVAVCLVAAWAWLALMNPGGEEAQSKLVEERGSSAASRGVGRAKASDSERRGKAGDPAKSAETGKKSALESRSGGESGSGSAGGSAEPSSIVVYVSGAVRTPGVYTLAAGSRVDDAVRAAGGLTERAESAGTNLAAQLSDGEHVHVAATGESAPPGAFGPSSGSDAAGGEKGAKASGKGSGKGAAAGQKAGTAKVNVNTAGVEELQTLPGVGPATAKAIISWREENGRFRSVDDLLDVSGIGKATLAKFRDRVSV